MHSSKNPKQRRGGRRGQRPQEPQEFDQKLVEIRRVTRVMAGGKRMRFRALIVLGDRKGRVAYGIGKGPDVTLAVQKAVTKAKARMVHVPMVNDTIPHDTIAEFGGARVLLKPAPRGTGVKAGGPVRSVLDLAGVQNVVAKMLGSKSKMNNVKAVIDELGALKTASAVGKSDTSKKKKK